VSDNESRLLNFDAVQWREFASPGFGLLIKVPHRWVNKSDRNVFLVADTESDTHIAVSAYANPGIDLDRWAVERVRIVQNDMPFLKQTAPGQRLDAQVGPVILTEFRGVFPNQSQEVYYLVDCIRTEKLVVSLVLIAGIEDYETNRDFYWKMLRENVDIYSVDRIKAGG
jgi:hypothetical protein